MKLETIAGRHAEQITRSAAAAAQKLVSRGWLADWFVSAEGGMHNIVADCVSHMVEHAAVLAAEDGCSMSELSDIRVSEAIIAGCNDFYSRYNHEYNTHQTKRVSEKRYGAFPDANLLACCDGDSGTDCETCGFLSASSLPSEVSLRDSSVGGGCASEAGVAGGGHPAFWGRLSLVEALQGAYTLNRISINRVVRTLSDGEVEALVAYAESGSYSRAAQATGRHASSVARSVTSARRKLTLGLPLTLPSP